MEAGDCDIHPSGFEGANLRSVQARQVRELVLRPTALQA
jgi:hypothetical protein